MKKRLMVGMIISAGMIGMSAMAEMLVKEEPLRPTEKIMGFNGRT